MSSKSSNQQNQMKSFYRQRKKSDTAIPKSSSSSSTKKSHSAASATLGSAVTQPLSLPYAAASTDRQDEGYEEKEEEVLRQFDMNMAYGPCLGMSRVDRWDRASRLGLNPPKEIRSLLDVNSNARSHSLWDARI